MIGLYDELLSTQVVCKNKNCEVKSKGLSLKGVPVLSWLGNRFEAQAIS